MRSATFGVACFLLGLRAVATADSTQPDVSPPATSVGGTLSSSSQPSATWRWASGIANRGGDFFSFDPGDGYSPAWNMGFAAYANPTDPRKNVVMTWGWNTSSHGTVDGTKGTFALSIENNYEVGRGFPNQMEYYWLFTPPGQAGYRWLSANGQVGPPYGLNVALRGTQVSVGTGHSISDPGSLLITSDGTAYLRSTSNTYGLLTNNNELRLFAPKTGGGQVQVYVQSDRVSSNVPYAPNRTDALDLGFHSSSPDLRKHFRVGYFTRGVQMGSTSGNRPPCDATTRGRLYTVQGGHGEADATYQCMKSSANVYDWKMLLSGDD